MTGTFRIVSGGRPVGTIIATNREDAVDGFARGRELPPDVDLRAYSVRAFETRRPRPARGWRA